MLKSLLLAAGLAVGASTLGDAKGGGLVAHPVAERTRPAVARHGAAPPRLVLLPAVPAGWPARGAAGGPPETPAAGVGPAARAEFVARARRLVAERLAAERCCR